MDQLDPDPASTGHKNDASGPEDGVAVSPGAGSLDHPAGNSAGAGDDLTGAVAGLLGLAMARSSLPDLLTQVAGFAVQAIPGADGAGLTLLKRDRPDVVVFSAPFVQQVDDIQYGLDEGPCVTAAATGRTMRSGSLGTDHRWPLFGPQAGRLGVHSVLSLPLHAAGTVLGVLNVYSRPRNAFGGHATRRGEQFAVPAAVAVQNARILADAQRVAVNLQRLLTTRAVIDQAIGVLINRSGISAEQAFNRLRTISHTERIKVHTVATRIVDDAIRRAGARRKDD